MLHLHHLSKDFAGKPLFTDIGWHLKKGERVGLVGENGAGKSTLMRVIAGQVEPTDGSGTLVSWTVIRKPPAAFKEIGVFAVAIVRLREGVQVTGRLDRFDPVPSLGAKVRIGESVGGVPIFSLEGT